MKRYTTQIPGLLDTLAKEADVQSLSDLHNLNMACKRALVCELEKISPEEYSIAEWNDAVVYLTNGPPAESPQAAKMWLLEKLIDS